MIQAEQMTDLVRQDALDVELVFFGARGKFEAGIKHNVGLIDYSTSDVVASDFASIEGERSGNGR